MCLLLSAGSLQLMLLVLLLLFVCAIICFPCCLLLCLEEDFEGCSGTVCTMALCVYRCFHTAPTNNWCNAVCIRWYIAKRVPIIVITRNKITRWIIIQLLIDYSLPILPTFLSQHADSKSLSQYHLSSSTYNIVVRKLIQRVVTNCLRTHKFPHAQLINCKISWSCNTKVDELNNWVNHTLLTICLVYFIKGGPLSLLMTVGMPCVTSIRSNLGIIALAEVEWTMSTSGNLE